MQSYQTLAANATARIVQKKSEFIASVAPVQDEESALAFLGKIRTAHRTASHNVFAYSLRKDNRQRYSDDGEPSKTAGLPVLDVITHFPLVDCIVVVTRYFGGTLLGTGGLVRAYTAASQAALQSAEVLVVRPCVTVSLALGYAQYEQARHIFVAGGAKMQEPQFAEEVHLCATMPAGQEKSIIQALQELCRRNEGIHTSEIFFAPF